MTDLSEQEREARQKARAEEIVLIRKKIAAGELSIAGPEIDTSDRVIVGTASFGKSELHLVPARKKGTWKDVMAPRNDRPMRDITPVVDLLREALGNPKPPPPDPAPNMGKSRNGPCPCGSGKKFKKCCLGLTAEQHRAKADEAEAKLMETIKAGLPEIFYDESDSGDLEGKVKATLEATPLPEGGGTWTEGKPLDLPTVIEDIQKNINRNVVSTIESFIP